MSAATTDTKKGRTTRNSLKTPLVTDRATTEMRTQGASGAGQPPSETQYESEPHTYDRRSQSGDTARNKRFSTEEIEEATIRQDLQPPTSHTSHGTHQPQPDSYRVVEGQERDEAQRQYFQDQWARGEDERRRTAVEKGKGRAPSREPTPEDDGQLTLEQAIVIIHALQDQVERAQQRRERDEDRMQERIARAIQKYETERVAKEAEAKERRESRPNRSTRMTHFAVPASNERPPEDTTRPRRGPDSEARLRAANLMAETPTTSRPAPSISAGARTTKQQRRETRTEYSQQQTAGAPGAPGDPDDDDYDDDFDRPDPHNHQRHDRDRDRRHGDIPHLPPISAAGVNPRFQRDDTSRDRYTSSGRGVRGTKNPWRQYGDNFKTWVRKIYRQEVDIERDSLPDLGKLFKPVPPAVWDGPDNVKEYTKFIMSTCVYFNMLRYTGPDYEQTRIKVMGQLLSGPALTYYNNHVVDPLRPKRYWTTLELFDELFDQFVHSATAQAATQEYDDVRYLASTGVSGLYNALRDAAVHLPQQPDDFSFRRRLWKELPHHLVKYMVKYQCVSLEMDNTDDILEEALAAENTMRAISLHAQTINQTRGRAGETRTSTPKEGNNPNRSYRSNTNSQHNTQQTTYTTPSKRYSSPPPSRVRFHDNKRNLAPSASTRISKPPQVTNKPAGGSEKRAMPTPGPSQRTSQKAGPSDKRHIKCFRCGNMGHYATDPECPGGQSASVRRIKDTVTPDTDKDDTDRVEEMSASDNEENEEGQAGEDLEGKQYDSESDPVDRYEEYPVGNSYYDSSSDERLYSMNVVPISEDEDVHSTIQGTQASTSTNDSSDSESEGKESDTDYATSLNDSEDEIPPLEDITPPQSPSPTRSPHPVGETYRPRDNELITTDNAREWQEQLPPDEFFRKLVHTLEYHESRQRDNLGMTSQLEELQHHVDRMLVIIPKNIVQDSQVDTVNRQVHIPVQVADRSTGLTVHEAHRARIDSLEEMVTKMIMHNFDSRSDLIELSGRILYNVDNDIIDLVDVAHQVRQNDAIRRTAWEGSGTPHRRGQIASSNEEANRLAQRVRQNHYVDDIVVQRTTAMREFRLHAITTEEPRAYRTAMRISSKTINRPVTPNACLTAYVEVQMGSKRLRAFVLFDSGSSINCISPDFATVAQFTVLTLEQPMGLQLGCVGSRSKINYGIQAVVEIGEAKLETYFDVANIDHYDVILGCPFLLANKVALEFSDSSIRFGNQIIPALKGEGTAARKRVTEKTVKTRRSVDTTQKPQAEQE